MNSARSKDDFEFRSHPSQVPIRKRLDLDLWRSLFGAPAVDHAGDFVLDEEMVVRSPRDDVQVVANAGMRSFGCDGVLGVRDPTDAVLIAICAFSLRLDTGLDPSIPSRFCVTYHEDAVVNKGINAYSALAIGRAGNLTELDPCRRRRRYPMYIHTLLLPLPTAA